MNYPSPQVELDIVRNETGISEAQAKQLVQLAKALRSLTEHDLEETASTRLLVSAGRLVASGLPLQVACQAAIIDALTDDIATAQALAEVVRALFGDAA
jgi:nitric oxide reductase NorQ protein